MPHEMAGLWFLDKIKVNIGDDFAFLTFNMDDK